MSYPVSLLQQGQIAQDHCSDTSIGKKFLVIEFPGFQFMLIPSYCHWAPLKRVHLSDAKSQISQKASYQINLLINIYSSMQLFREFTPVYRCRLLALHNRILQKFSLVPMSANDRHEQAAEQRTMNRRDVLEIKISVHFPIGKFITCSHSTKIHRQGICQPKKRLLIFVEGLHKLLLHFPNLPQNAILMTAQFCH